MSYLFVAGYRTGLSKKKLVGIKPCENCGRFSEHYLSKSFFRIVLFWFIPIFGVPTGKYLHCTNCNGVRKLTRAEWVELKKHASTMPKKKKYLQAYEQLKLIVQSSDADQLTLDAVYPRLMEQLDLSDEGGHIRELVDVYLANSQAAANIANTVESKELAGGSAEPSPTEKTLVVTDESDAVRVIPTAPIPPNVPIAGVAENIAAADAKPRKNLRRLWLIPAILLIPVLLFMTVAMVIMFSDPTIDLATNIVGLVLFVLLPLGLDILFFCLASRKK